MPSGQHPNSRANLIPAKPGEARNPKGKPKGAIHMSTRIQRMLNDPDFEATLLDSRKGVVEFKGEPIKAIIATAIQKALYDKEKGVQWAEWLAKHGYTQKLELGGTGNTYNIALVEFIDGKPDDKD